MTSGDVEGFVPPDAATLAERLALIGAPVDAAGTARRELAAVVRDVLQALNATSADAAAAERATVHARALLAELRGAPPRPHDHLDYHEHSPMVGHANPLAPPLDLVADEHGVHGTATFGDAYEGPPGHLHGGFVACLLDEVLGFVQSLTGNPGMTARLSIAYRAPTPLHVPLRLGATVLRVDGRKIFTRATIHHDDRLCAEADGLFLSIGRERFEAMAAVRTRRHQHP